MLFLFYVLTCTLWVASSSAKKVYGPHLPDTYIKIIPHPHSVNTDITIIPLSIENGNAGSPGPVSQMATAFTPTPQSRPWAPFWTLADFEYTETAVKGLLSEDLVNRQLVGFNEAWSIGGSHLTIHNYKDMQKSLAVARGFGIQVGVLLPFLHGMLIRSLALVQAGQSISNLPWWALGIWIPISRPLGVCPLSHSRQIPGIRQQLEFGSKVLLLLSGEMRGACYWWTEYSRHLVGDWCKYSFNKERMY